jgi:hypothetical protein
MYVIHTHTHTHTHIGYALFFEPENYFEPLAGKMSLAHIDPSLALGFYCDDKNDFEDLIRYTQSMCV